MFQGEHLQEQCDISCNTNEEKSTDEHRVSETLTVHGASCDQSVSPNIVYTQYSYTHNSHLSRESF